MLFSCNLALTEATQERPEVENKADKDVVFNAGS